MWFTEDAWSPILVCMLTSGLFFVAYAMTQRAKLLLVIPCLVLIAIAAFFIERSVVTDRERVEMTLIELIDTFVEESQQTTKNKEPRCVRFFGVQNKRDQARVAAAVLMVRVEEPRVTDIQIKLTNENTRAITHFRANGIVSVGGGGGHYASRWELTWQKEAGDWKVTATRMLNAVSGEEQAIPRVD